MDKLNSAKLDATLAKSAQAIEDSWTTVGLQRGMNSLVKDMSEDFEAVFVASEDIKKLMQGVYNTFIAKFGFQKMKLPALDLDPQRTKLQLLVMQTEAFVKDPVNVVVKEKHFVVKNFYATLVKEARRNFGDAKSQAERWIQAVVLPLEVQIKDHKAQLQSRLDNLAKINEKTGSINEQMATLKATAAELAKQREMIEGLIARVSEYESVSAAAAPAAPARAPQAVPAEQLRTTRTPAPEPASAKPLISDDLMAQLGPVKAGAAPQAPAFNPEATQRFPEGSERTQKLPDGADRTQRLPEGSDRTQRLDGAERTQRVDVAAAAAAQKPKGAADGDQTMKIPALDPAYRPETTQKIPPAAPLTDAQTTQRLDESIQRLQEAKRMLQKQGK